jgi:Txe/YoeB family toxin of Txe-Axe toxin-antitoxin module
MEAWKAMILKIKIFWAWIKKNWKLTVLTIWSVLVWFISRRSSQGAIDAMNANKVSYEAQIKSLKEQHNIEVKKREELHLKYQETLAKIEEKYKKKKEQLSKVEKKKVKEIVKEAKDNPDEINRKIEDLFGFTSDT